MQNGTAFTGESLRRMCRSLVKDAVFSMGWYAPWESSWGSINKAYLSNEQMTSHTIRVINVYSGNLRLTPATKYSLAYGLACWACEHEIKASNCTRVNAPPSVAAKGSVPCSQERTQMIQNQPETNLVTCPTCSNYYAVRKRRKSKKPRTCHD